MSDIRKKIIDHLYSNNQEAAEEDVNKKIDLAIVARKYGFKKF